MEKHTQTNTETPAGHLSLDAGSFLGALGEPALLLDDAGRILGANEAALRLLDSSPEITGRHLGEFLTETPFLPDCEAPPRVDTVELRKPPGDTRERLLDLSCVRVESKRLFLARFRPLPVSVTEGSSFRAVLESAFDAVFLKDSNSRYIATNPALDALYQRSGTEILGLTDRDIFDDAFSDLSREEDRRVLTGGRVEDVRERVLDGETRSFHVVKTPLRDESGRIYGICGIAREVTRQRVLEAKLRETSDRFKGVLDNVPGTVFSFLRHPDGSRTMRFASAGYSELLGPESARALLAGEVDFLEFIHPEDLSFDEDFRRDEENGHIQFRGEHRVRHEDGAYRWMQARSHGIPQENGDTLWHGFLLDIEDRKRTERALEASNQRIQTLAEQLPGAIFSYLRHPDGGMTRLYSSPGYGRILGQELARRLLSGEVHYSELIHPDDLDTAEELKHDEETGDLVFNVEYRIRDEVGRYKWVHIHSHGTPQENGDILWNGILLDIDDRRRAEQQLHDASQRLQALAEQIPGAMYSYLQHADDTRTRLYSSPGYIRILGRELADKVLEGDLRFSDLVHPEDRRIAKEVAWDEETGRLGYNVECRVRGEDDLYKWVHVVSTGIPQRSGEVLWHGLLLDIDARKSAERQLQEASQRLQTLAEQLPGAIYSFYRHPDGSLTRIYSSPGYAHLLGEDTANRLFENDLDYVELIHPDDREQALEVVEDEETGVRHNWGEYRILTSSGDYIWLEDHSHGFPVENGDYLWQGILLDISERKRIGEELGRATIQIRSLAENLPGALISYTVGADDEQAIHYLSPGAEGILGAEAVGRCLEDASYFETLVHPDDRHFFTPEHRGMNRERLFFNEEYRLRHPDGRHRWVSSHGRGTVQREGEVLWHGFIMDIDDRKRAEDQLRLHSQTLEQSVHSLNEAKMQAELAAQARGQFLANMSHEIRTPLTAVLGFAEILGESISGDQEREALNVIMQNGRHLLRIINDILDLSKIEAGRIDLDVESFDPAAEIRNVVKLMEPRVAESSLRLVYTVDDDLPARIDGDSTRLRQILLNLLGNAIKFTEQGEVSVHASVGDAAPPRLLIEVMDTGIGMDPEEFERLFQAFHQADSSTSRIYGGTGLGLTISKHLAELMGGALVASARPGGGSRFLLTLPLRRAKESSPPSTPERAAPPERLEARILLAEDNRTNQRIVQSILGKVGCEVELAGDGQRALEMEFEARAEGRPYDAILMDIQMPVMDGLAATRALRAAGRKLPIIALTAHALNEDRQRCLEAGCDEHCGKPIDRAELIGKLADWIRRG